MASIFCACFTNANGKEMDNNDERVQLAALAEPPTFFHDQLKGRRWPARVFSVHDGDTLNLAIVFHGQPMRLACRMLGYDSPEVNAKDPRERALAKEATAVLRQAVGLDDSGTIEVEFFGKEKYGRQLARAYRVGDGVCINDEVMQHAFNVRYDGGARQVVHQT